MSDTVSWESFQHHVREIQARAEAAEARAAALEAAGEALAKAASEMKDMARRDPLNNIAVSQSLARALVKYREATR